MLHNLARESARGLCIDLQLLLNKTYDLFNQSILVVVVLAFPTFMHAALIAFTIIGPI
ncbi:hypothetical protein T266_09635 [Pseudomonas aeruginosa VRFPA05]|nr:hypothetical protein T266_09635 [Pseudomonas aeruginosa VRFPA05]